ncbi:ParB-like nuclease domain-containing protein [Bradyrhizobium erythrophlei]|nr:ParB-like nuclease domain-containing protein [Bradyrhizobium erythrophlei]
MSAYSSKAGILVPLAALRLHGQSLLLLEHAKVKRFAESMREGQEFPPVQVRKEGEVYHLLDGYHRQQASHQCSFTHIPVEIVRMP